MYVIKNATPPKTTKFTVETIAGFAFNKYVNVMYINGEWNKYIPKLLSLMQSKILYCLDVITKP